MFSVDLYFSFRSPYSYFILPRIIELRDNYDVNINFKLVYPLAIREPNFFLGKNAFTYFIPKIFDYFLQAKKLGMKFKPPKPDPIKQNILTGKISNNQPLIFDLCHFGQSMCRKNLGIEFAYEISNLIGSPPSPPISTLDLLPHFLGKLRSNHQALACQTPLSEALRILRI